MRTVKSGSATYTQTPVNFEQIECTYSIDRISFYQVYGLSGMSVN